MSFEEGDYVTFVGGNAHLDNGEIITAGRSGYIIEVLEPSKCYLVEFEVATGENEYRPIFSHAEIDDKDLIYGN